MELLGSQQKHPYSSTVQPRQRCVDHDDPSQRSSPPRPAPTTQASACRSRPSTPVRNPDLEVAEPEQLRGTDLGAAAVEPLRPGDPDLLGFVLLAILAPLDHRGWQLAGCCFFETLLAAQTPGLQSNRRKTCTCCRKACAVRSHILNCLCLRQKVLPPPPRVPHPARTTGKEPTRAL